MGCGSGEWGGGWGVGVENGVVGGGRKGDGVVGGVRGGCQRGTHHLINVRNSLIFLSPHPTPESSFKNSRNCSTRHIFALASLTR